MADETQTQTTAVLMVMGYLAKEALEQGNMLSMELALKVIARVCSPPHLITAEDQ